MRYAVGVGVSCTYVVGVVDSAVECGLLYKLLQCAFTHLLLERVVNSIDPAIKKHLKNGPNSW